MLEKKTIHDIVAPTVCFFKTALSFALDSRLFFEARNYGRKAPPQSVLLQFRGRHGEMQPPRRQNALDTSMRKKCILTVDDSTSVRHMVSQTLAEAGFDVLEAVDGLDALDKLDKLEGDLTLILCDVNMPNMNGLEAVRRIRAHPAGKFIPIVMLTTESRKDIRDKGKLAGASGWITKPFDADDLLSIIRRFIR